MTRYGWRESFRHREHTEKAITKANLVLAPMGLSLRPAWNTSTSEGLPVFLVDGDRLTSQHIVFVPHDERCIVINADQIDSLLEGFAPPVDYALRLDADDVLTFCLLHEAGHISAGHSGSLVEGTTLARNEVLAVALSPKDLKSRAIIDRHPELGADLFALDAINAAATSSDETVAMLGIELTFLISNLAWNLGLVRDPEGAGFGGQRGTFFDSSYSHPNLEFRLRVVSFVAGATPGSLTVDYALDSFFDARGGNKSGRPYWELPEFDTTLPN